MRGVALRVCPQLLGTNTYVRTYVGNATTYNTEHKQDKIHFVSCSINLLPFPVAVVSEAGASSAPAALWPVEDAAVLVVDAVVDALVVDAVEVDPEEEAVVGASAGAAAGHAGETAAAASEAFSVRDAASSVASSASSVASLAAFAVSTAFAFLGSFFADSRNSTASEMTFFSRDSLLSQYLVQNSDIAGSVASALHVAEENVVQERFDVWGRGWGLSVVSTLSKKEIYIYMREGVLGKVHAVQVTWEKGQKIKETVGWARLQTMAIVHVMNNG